MRATLIYNAAAGGASGVSSDDLQAALVDVGYNPVYRATTTEEDLDRALADETDLVVAAGGDGTIRGVVGRLAGRGVPLALVPMGTANNIAGSLGISGPPLEVVRGLAEPQPCAFDVGMARAPWGEDHFLEAAGTGIFASVLAAYDPDAGKSPLRALTSVVSTLTGYAPRRLRLSLDGQDLSGDYILVEVMNTPAAGPRLRLAPNANPCDGLLDVVTVTEDGRVGLTAYLSGLVTGRLEDLPNVTVHQAREVTIEWDGSPFHLDAVLRPAKEASTPPEAPCDVSVSLQAGAVQLLLPRRQPQAEDASSPPAEFGSGVAA